MTAASNGALPNGVRGQRPAEGLELPLSRFFSHRGKQFGAMFVLKCGQNFIKIAIHDRTELIKRQIDAVVCDAALRVVVSANAFAAVAAAD